MHIVIHQSHNQARFTQHLIAWFYIEGFYIHEVEEYEEMFCKFLNPVLITV